MNLKIMGLFISLMSNKLSVMKGLAYFQMDHMNTGGSDSLEGNLMSYRSIGKHSNIVFLLLESKIAF